MAKGKKLTAFVEMGENMKVYRVYSCKEKNLLGG